MTDDKIANWLDRFGGTDRDLIEEAEASAREASRTGGLPGDLYAEEEDRGYRSEVAWDDPDEMDWEPEPIAAPTVQLRSVNTGPSTYRHAIRAAKARRTA